MNPPIQNQKGGIKRAELKSKEEEKWMPTKTQGVKGQEKDLNVLSKEESRGLRAKMKDKDKGQRKDGSKEGGGAKSNDISKAVAEEVEIDGKSRGGRPQQEALPTPELFLNLTSSHHPSLLSSQLYSHSAQVFIALSAPTNMFGSSKK